VPLLSKVPLLGKLFSRNERNHERTQRFFFITPRIVDMRKEATDPADYTATSGNDLALPSYLSNDQLSRDKVEDLARRLAAGNHSAMHEQAVSGKRPNAILPPLSDVPKALPMDEPQYEIYDGVTPPPTVNPAPTKRPIPSYMPRR
jgi:type III secretion protein C